MEEGLENIEGGKITRERERERERERKEISEEEELGL